MIINHRMKKKCRITLLYLVVTIILMFVLGPFAWLIISSVSTERELLSVPIHWIPQQSTLENYRKLFLGQGVEIHERAALEFMPSILNSFIVAVSVTVVSLIVGSLSAYSFARLRFSGRRALFILILFTQMLPAFSLVIPLYLVMRYFHLLNTHLGLILPYFYITLPFAIWMMTGYLRAIPSSLEDSARVDGCSRLEALIKIVIPLSAPGMVAVIIFCFLMCWSEFFMALIFTSSISAKTMPAMMAEFTGRYALNYSILTTGGVLGSIIPVALALTFQKYIIKGLTAGAVKG